MTFSRCLNYVFAIAALALPLLEAQTAPKLAAIPGVSGADCAPPAGEQPWLDAKGYYLMLNPLPPGTHTIHITGTFHDPLDPTHPVLFPLDTTITLTVSPH